MLKPMLGAWPVSHFNTDHEQTQYNQVLFFFIYLAYSLLPKDLTIHNLFK